MARSGQHEQEVADLDRVALVEAPDQRREIDPAEVRISAFLNISYLGLAGHDFELTNLNYCDVRLFEILILRGRFRRSA